MTKFNKVQDSGKRQEFNTGSQRDTDEGKGQPHLLPGEVLILLQDNLNCLEISSEETTVSVIKKLGISLYQYGIIKDSENQLDLLEAITWIIIYIARQETGHYVDAYRRLAIHYQNGAKKYRKNNWRKGQPISRYYDSAVRHYWAILASKKDEDHEAAVLWNLVAIIQTKKDIEKGLLSKELDDFPFTIKDVWDKKK